MRRILALATVLCAALALPSHAAAPKPQITDAVGDVLVPDAGADIVSGLFATTGTTARVGRKTVYTPTKLVMTITYAATVTTSQAVAHAITFTTEGCGDVYLEVYTGGTFGQAGCLADPFTFSARTSGKTVTMTMSLSTLGKGVLRAGMVLESLRAYTAVADPVLGYETGEFGGDEGALDFAHAAGAYVIR